MEGFSVTSVIALLAVVTMIPSFIVRHKTDKVVYWWLATVCTGFFPGLIASFLYRYAGQAAVPAFFGGFLAYLGIGIGLAYLWGAL